MPIFQGIFLSNWLVLIAGIISFLTIYAVRVRDEEEMMLRRFGAAYKNYMKNTGRLLPKFR